MGGNALKSVYTRRYSKDEFEALSNEVLGMLNNLGIIALIPKSYFEKDSFGDLDVLIQSESLRNRNIREISSYFNPKEVYSNSHITSFDYKEFQIDFILVPEKIWNTSEVYFSYNDLGNFMGRISYNMGFRYGDYGLKLVYIFDNGGKKFSMNISNEPQKIFEFLGFDWKKYTQGFNNLDEIFNYIVNSRYFNSSIFDYENLDHQNRTRNRKRKNYTLFLDFVKENTFNDYEFQSREYYLKEAESFFDVDIFTEIDKWEDIMNNEKLASEKFNGQILIDRYSLKGKEIGVNISNFKKHVQEEILKSTDKIEYTNWIIDNSNEKLFEIFEKVNNINYVSNTYGENNPLGK